MVRFENVGMRYGAGPEVLSDVTFALKPGSFHFVTGPSGAGKSSLLKLMYLAHRPSRGFVTLFDRDVTRMPRSELFELRRRIGVVFQDFRLVQHLSAFDNVALPLRVAGSREDVIQKHVTELLTWVGLKDHLHARPPTLSGGQQQRVAIARAVIAHPKLLLADEPTGNLDQNTGARVIELMFNLARQQQATVIFVTHDPALAARADRVLTMTQGNLSEGIR